MPIKTKTTCSTIFVHDTCSYDFGAVGAIFTTRSALKLTEETNQTEVLSKNPANLPVATPVDKSDPVVAAGTPSPSPVGTLAISKPCQQMAKPSAIRQNPIHLHLHSPPHKSQSPSTNPGTPPPPTSSKEIITAYTVISSGGTKCNPLILNNKNTEQG